MTTTGNEVTEMVSATIDGIEVNVPQGTLIIRAAEQAGIHIPRFCDHPLLKPAGACRQCLVEVAMPDREGNVRPMPKPQASCTMTVTAGMEVKTQHTSEVADKAQHGIMEFLLINHPLDCPVCDKGGECPLQNQAMSNGRATSRFVDIKRTFPKPIRVSTQILLDRDRCILCQRCTRFSAQIAGDPFISLQGRGGGSPAMEVHGLHSSQIGTFDEHVLDFAGGDEPQVRANDITGPHGDAGLTAGLAAGPVGVAERDESGRPFASYFSGNTIQICPVGALTSATYRFRSRPFDLVSTDAVAEHDASGAAIRVDMRRGKVLRRLAGNDPEVNEEWISDKDRFAFTWQDAPDRLRMPLVRDEESGELVETSWAEALDIAARELRRARDMGPLAALPGGRLTVEDAYAWSKFARLALQTNHVDYRARAHSDEEAEFLAAQVANRPLDVTFGDLEVAPCVLMVAFEAEEEAANVFLRLRKGVLADRVHVATIAPYLTRGSHKLAAELIPAAPGTETEVVNAIVDGSQHASLNQLSGRLSAPGSVIIVGERAATTPGLLAAVRDLAERSGARLVWIPRRIGERAAIDAGLLPNLLPGGRSASDSEARVDVASVWDVPSLPQRPGANMTAILHAMAAGEIPAAVIGGVDLVDLPDPKLAAAACKRAFVVQLEVRRSAITPLSQVVFPVAPPVEKAGTYLNWEGRYRPFGQVRTSHEISDRQVLADLGAAMGVDLKVDTLSQVHTEVADLREWSGTRPTFTTPARIDVPRAGGTDAVLASWRLLLDSGRMQECEPHLAGTAQRAVARLAPEMAERIGAHNDMLVRVSGPAGSVELPLVLTDMPDRVVWVPQNSPGCSIYTDLGAPIGSIVQVTPADATKEVSR
ncbi:MAG: NADH-quinone oxidoreductase subunit G [Bowdeniella nasicola]|nr:NADH-quinone oxidoreductase subunit G [Bowdeniella nasicola]